MWGIAGPPGVVTRHGGVGIEPRREGCPSVGRRRTGTRAVWGVCTGAVVTALSYRPRALLPPASHASLTAAPMLVAVAAARSSRSLYVVYAAYPCFICAKDGIVLMVHLRYVSGTMMRVWNGLYHGHHRPWRPPGRQGLSSPCGAVWLFQLHFEQSRPAPGQHLHRQNRQKSVSTQTRIPLFPIAKYPAWRDCG